MVIVAALIVGAAIIVVGVAIEDRLTAIINKLDHIRATIGDLRE